MPGAFERTHRTAHGSNRRAFAITNGSSYVRADDATSFSGALWFADTWAVFLSIPFAYFEALRDSHGEAYEVTDPNAQR